MLRSSDFMHERAFSILLQISGSPPPCTCRIQGRQRSRQPQRHGRVQIPWKEELKCRQKLVILFNSSWFPVQFMKTPRAVFLEEGLVFPTCWLARRHHPHQWRRSVVKSEGSIRVSQVKPSSYKPTEIHFRFRRWKWAIWSFSAFFNFSRKWIFIFILFFFVPKMSFALGRKCYIRNWSVTKFCDIGQARRQVVFIIDAVKLAVIHNSFEWKNVTFYGGQNIPSYIFSGEFRTPPGSTPLVSHPSCRRSIVGRTACELWTMRTVDGGSPARTFWSFCLGHDNFKPSGAAKALIGGHSLLGADQT